MRTFVDVNLLEVLGINSFAIFVMYYLTEDVLIALIPASIASVYSIFKLISDFKRRVEDKERRKEEKEKRKEEKERHEWARLEHQARMIQIKGNTEDIPEYAWIEVSNSSTEIFKLKLKKREKLYGYRYNDKEVRENLPWSDMYVKVIKDLFSQEKDQNARRTLGETLDIIPIATKKKKGNYKRLFDGYELNTNNNTTNKIEKLIRALEHHRNKNSLFVRIKN